MKKSMPSISNFTAKSFQKFVRVAHLNYVFILTFFYLQKSKKTLTTRSLSLIIYKKNKQSEYWPRLTKEKVKNAFLKTDFSKWVDEDEQNGDAVAEDPDPDMGGMGGMGGGMDFEKARASSMDNLSS
jgi:hypothetical protein